MPQQQNLSIPLAIVIAGAFIAGALYFSSNGLPSFSGGDAATNEPSTSNVAPVTADDHIKGSKDAKVIIVEYTDLECPFCKAFHITMNQIMAEYGAGGQVAWVIRNFPLQQLHPNAPKLAEAAECVAELGGNEAYFDFLDAVFERAPINTFFDFSEMDATVAEVGVNTASFNECLNSGRYQEKIGKEFQNAVDSGGQGTPHNIVIKKNGDTELIPGAQPYETVKSAIESALK